MAFWLSLGSCISLSMSLIKCKSIAVEKGKLNSLTYVCLYLLWNTVVCPAWNSAGQEKTRQLEQHSISAYRLYAHCVQKLLINTHLKRKRRLQKAGCDTVHPKTEESDATVLETSSTLICSTVSIKLTMSGVGWRDEARTQLCRRMGFILIIKNKTKQQQKLPRRGKTGQLACLARQDRAGHDRARQETPVLQWRQKGIP